ncbi:hypothetical protein D3P09_15770 [Paenibacillus pinisoli]|uniref:Uncharacterized protein n=1 Tax=Paenibacillus pinisoli TaxID=1276110 RepID=A0A3A6PT84_9BACL|nr:hypothetical protein [Paenibacillus pinisoli]RJX38963.1 hypothetical protein D3P09_15770 [Paenibacillus pinisoli]
MFIAWLVKNDLVSKRALRSDKSDIELHVEDSLQNYLILEPVITERYEEWKRHGKLKQKDVQ